MFCNNCGAEIADGAAFCTNCGATQEATQGATVQPQAPMGYGQQPVYTAQAEPDKSVGLAVAGMVLGIVALVFSCCFPYITFVCALVGCILSGVSLAKHKGGKGMAVAGLVCSIIGLVPAIMVVVAGASILSALSSLM